MKRLSFLKLMGLVVLAPVTLFKVLTKEAPVKTVASLTSVRSELFINKGTLLHQGNGMYSIFFDYREGEGLDEKRFGKSFVADFKEGDDLSVSVQVKDGEINDAIIEKLPVMEVHSSSLRPGKVTKAKEALCEQGLTEVGRVKL